MKAKKLFPGYRLIVMSRNSGCLQIRQENATYQSSAWAAEQDGDIMKEVPIICSDLSLAYKFMGSRGGRKT